MVRIYRLLVCYLQLHYYITLSFNVIESTILNFFSKFLKSVSISNRISIRIRLSESQNCSNQYQWSINATKKNKSFSKFLIMKINHLYTWWIYLHPHLAYFSQLKILIILIIKFVPKHLQLSTFWEIKDTILAGCATMQADF